MADWGRGSHLRYLRRGGERQGRDRAPTELLKEGAMRATVCGPGGGVGFGKL